MSQVRRGGVPRVRARAHERKWWARE